MAMVIWIMLVAVSVAALLALRLLRRRDRPVSPSLPEHTPTVPVEIGSTIRSYVVPKRWLGSDAGRQRASAQSVEQPRYASARVERASEGGAGGDSWDLLRGRTRLGRDSDNHVVLDDERVSLHHALITVRDGVYWLEDLGSTNGTFVGDDHRVMAAHPLVDGEVLRLSGVVLVFRGTPPA